ncbi:hypothetical protein RchiOBHm_Chr7g0209721 [Rosa chinensis]|uniref:Uncharacterized protein n=1 Tax=Rosa chinensis TaxID=74649 RepID=A0A2P6PA11_ROSCH|nr:hypothetical protein RchiOBHm_Chr7g0209721 [Rosa chinensis]
MGFPLWFKKSKSFNLYYNPQFLDHVFWATKQRESSSLLLKIGNCRWRSWRSQICGGLALGLDAEKWKSLPWVLMHRNGREREEVA